MAARQLTFFLLLHFLALTVACSGRQPDYAANTVPAATQPGYRVVSRFPHDPAAFTQGLVYHGGFLYESTGLYGRSSLRKVAIDSGLTVATRKLKRRYFGEGLALQGETLVQLTWREGAAFAYSLDDFRKTARYPLKGEGWGLTFDGSHFIQSDGSATLSFLDPNSFRVSHRLQVREGDRPVAMLNELEMVRGEIFANILGSDRIARIDPVTGKITGWLDLAHLRGKTGSWRQAADLNGIAYDPDTDHLFITGKRWPWLFVLALEPSENPTSDPSPATYQ